MKKILSTSLIVLCLSGCIGYGNGIMSYAINGSSSKDRNFTQEELDKIEVFFGVNTKPSQPYIQLSYLEATGEHGASMDDLIQLLKREAAKYGADAIIEVSRISEAREVGTVVMTEGNYTYDAMVLTGIAIKYTENAKKLDGNSGN
ncbi:hypothetical protein BFP97_03710 [Roseivirga sp. 4D4]|uniref:hypothetical protein n=1 Tax=Roseivirga sp. 4D4 TaxID=1889784 RepID=UPI0008529121|nr:hypothetical protein [Roseivirga sp. 4D4]OEK00665.1 hypothetical protein BFP97_03710 [Roseivirga sp. 4D4]